MRRRALFVLFSSVLLVAMGFVAPASAASTSGVLVAKGPGSLYSGPNTIVSEAVAAGQTGTYELRVYNTGAALAQFKLQIDTTYNFASRPDIQGELFAGSLSLKPLTTAPDGYYTTPIAAGKFVSLVVKVKIPAGTARGTIRTVVTLLSTADQELGLVDLRSEMPPPAVHQYGPGVYIQQGSQPFVGGPNVGPQLSTSPALKTKDLATFKVRLQNDTTGPAALKGEIDLFNAGACIVFTVMDGKVDVTAALVNRTYATPVLKSGAYQALTLTVRRVQAAGCGPYWLDAVIFTASVPSAGLSSLAAAVTPFAYV